MQDEEGQIWKKGYGGAWPRIERIRTDTSAIRLFPTRRFSDTNEQDDYEFEDEKLQHFFEDKGVGSQNVAATTTSSMHIEPKLKPGLIAEILRTRCCIPGSVFLVEKIDDMPLYLPDQQSGSSYSSSSESDSTSEEEEIRPKKKTVNNLAELVRKEQREQRQQERLQRRRERMQHKAGHRLVRLMLGDGVLCIQALLRPGNFGLLDGGLIYEGCYVRLGNFEVVEREVDDFGQALPEKPKTRLDREDDLFGDPALVEASRASSGKEFQEQQEEDRNKMFYFVVGEMVTVGWNSAYLGILRDQEAVGKVEQEVITVRDGKVTSTGPGMVVPASDEVDVAAEEVAASESALADAPLEGLVAEERKLQASVEASRQPNFAAVEHGAVHSRDITNAQPKTWVSRSSFTNAPPLRDSATASHSTLPRKFLPPQTTPHPSPGKPKATTTSAITSARLEFAGIEEYMSEEELDDEAFEKLDISMDRMTERRLFDAQRAEPPEPKPGEALQELQAAVVEQNKVNARAAGTTRVPSHNPNLVLAISDPRQPLKLTPLRSIPNLPYKQNWMVNVLAVVVSLSAVEPAHLPPYSQRSARLADPSTSKRVLLTVFLDPEEFAPAVGSVVLLVGVKNHRFDGGCLKKYANDRPREGTGKTPWWLENPRGLEWCQGEVSRLSSWWREQQQHQTDGGLVDMQIG